MVPLIRLLICLACGPAFACSYPDEGNMPLRRAVSAIKFLPETEAWATHMHKTGAVVQYALLLHDPMRENRRCYWPVEVRADGKVWRRYYVTPDGKNVLRQEAAAPRAAMRPEGSTAGAR